MIARFTILIITFLCLNIVYSKKINSNSQQPEKIYSNSRALIIGINDYQNVPSLTYAKDDAISIQNLLVTQFGFRKNNIQLLLNEDATKDAILDAFHNITKKSKENDRVLVFYAGHGDTDKLPFGGEKGYLIPVDGNIENKYRTCIPMEELYDIAQMSYAKHILYLVDACYGGLALSMKRGLNKETIPNYISRITRERGRQIITAGGKDQEVIEKSEWGHSALTKNLLSGLGEGFADLNEDGYITANELGEYAKERVTIDSEGTHTPVHGRIGSDLGEFIFTNYQSKKILNENSKEGSYDDIRNELEDLKQQLVLEKSKKNEKKLIYNNSYTLELGMLNNRTASYANRAHHIFSGSCKIKYNTGDISIGYGIENNGFEMKVSSDALINNGLWIFTYHALSLDYKIDNMLSNVLRNSLIDKILYKINIIIGLKGVTPFNQINETKDYQVTCIGNECEPYVFNKEDVKESIGPTPYIELSYNINKHLSLSISAEDGRHVLHSGPYYSDSYIAISALKLGYSF